MRKNESTIKNSLRREPNSYTMPTNPFNVLWRAAFMVVRISKPAPDNWLWVDDLVQTIGGGDIEQVRHMMTHMDQNKDTTDWQPSFYAQNKAVEAALGGHNHSILECVAGHLDRDIITMTIALHMNDATLMNARAFSVLMHAYAQKDDIDQLLGDLFYIMRTDLVDIIFPLCSAAQIDEICQLLAEERPNDIFYVQQLRNSQIQREQLVGAVGVPGLETGTPSSKL